MGLYRIAAIRFTLKHSAKEHSLRGSREKGVMRESAHFSARLKDEQKREVLERRGSLRNVVNDQTCRHTSQTWTFTPDPLRYVSATS